jgi:hypothetical protein
MHAGNSHEKKCSVIQRYVEKDGDRIIVQAFFVCKIIFSLKYKQIINQQMPLEVYLQKRKTQGKHQIVSCYSRWQHAASTWEKGAVGWLVSLLSHCACVGN